MKTILTLAFIFSVSVSTLTLAQSRSTSKGKMGFMKGEVDQLKIFPMEEDFVSFSSLDLPNFIRIEGATVGGAQGVTITKLDGPGEIVKVDSMYYWTWKPEPHAVGNTYTVKIAGKANRNGAQKDLATTSFSVSVRSVVKASSNPYFPASRKTHQATPFTKVTFMANELIAGLNGTYITEIYLNGQKMAHVEEPIIEFTPEFLADEGKTLEVKAFYKSAFMKDFILIDDQSFKIEPVPFVAIADNSWLTAGDLLFIKAYYDTFSGTSEIGSDHLNIESDGYFETTAKREPSSQGDDSFFGRRGSGSGGGGYFFDVKPTSKVSEIKKKNGQDVSITITDPLTHQTKMLMVTIQPKP